MTDIVDLFSQKQSGTSFDLVLEKSSIIFKMVWCSAGNFVMGKGATKGVHLLAVPEHTVTLTKGFWIAQTPITNRQWFAITKTHANSFYKRENLPVAGITWHDANMFCMKLTILLRELGQIQEHHVISLPTDAQWEYACRAGTEGLWYFGDDAQLLGFHAWYRENSYEMPQKPNPWNIYDRFPHPVGHKAPNPWNIYDLYGNVAEWCLDDFYGYNDISSSITIDPCYVKANDQFSIVRGGDCKNRMELCNSVERVVKGKDNPYRDFTGLRPVLIDKQKSL